MHVLETYRKQEAERKKKVLADNQSRKERVNRIFSGSDIQQKVGR